MKRILAIAALLLASCTTYPPLGSEWTDDGTFHKAVSESDRLVVRNGGFDCCHDVDDQAILYSTTNREEIVDFLSHLSFQPTQKVDYCMCCGYPGIDFYRGDKRLALTAVQHGFALRWHGFPGDAILTPESTNWLAGWFSSRNIESDVSRKLKSTLEREQAVGENGEPAPAFGGNPKTTLPAEPAGELDSPSDAVSQP